MEDLGPGHLSEAVGILLVGEIPYLLACLYLYFFSMVLFDGFWLGSVQLGWVGDCCSIHIRLVVFLYLSWTPQLQLPSTSTPFFFGARKREKKIQGNPKKEKKKKRRRPSNDNINNNRNHSCDSDSFRFTKEAVLSDARVSPHHRLGFGSSNPSPFGAPASSNTSGGGLFGTSSSGFGSGGTSIICLPSSVRYIRPLFAGTLPLFG